MTGQDMRKLVKDYIAAINSGDLDAIEKFFAPRAKSISVRGKDQAMGPAERRQYHQNLRAAFPDGHMTAQNIVVDAEKGTTSFEWKVVGTHKGGFMGVAPTNKKIEARGSSTLTIQDGLIAEETSYSDTASLMRQLGLQAPPAVAGPASKQP